MGAYDAKAIGRRVAAYRRVAGMTAEDLANAVGNGLTRTAVAKLENGHRVEVSTELLVQLAWALQVPPMVLLLPLENPNAQVEVGAVRSTMEGLGYWIEGIPVAGSAPEGAGKIGNIVHAEYRRLSASAIGFLDTMVELIDAQDGNGGSTLDQATRQRLNEIADAQTRNLSSSREVLGVIRHQLGLDDG